MATHMIQHATAIKYWKLKLKSREGRKINEYYTYTKTQ